MNKVLVQSRKQGKFNLQYSLEEAIRRKETKGWEIINDVIVIPVAARDPSTASLSVSGGGFGICKSWSRLIIVATLCVVAMMSVLWFALGCYGFYILVLGGRHNSSSPISE